MAACLPAVAAGVLATLAFYTRLNNLPMALGVIAFAWRPRASLKPGVTIAAIVACGVALFAWRTWFYTGVFSVFHGTQRDLLAIWQPGMTAAQFLQRAAASVMMVLTVNDPPRFDPYALPVLVGAAAAVLGLVPCPRSASAAAGPVRVLSHRHRRSIRRPRVGVSGALLHARDPDRVGSVCLRRGPCEQAIRRELGRSGWWGRWGGGVGKTNEGGSGRWGRSGR